MNLEQRKTITDAIKAEYPKNIINDGKKVAVKVSPDKEHPYPSFEAKIPLILSSDNPEKEYIKAVYDEFENDFCVEEESMLSDIRDVLEENEIDEDDALEYLHEKVFEWTWSEIDEYFAEKYKLTFIKKEKEHSRNV